MTPLLETYLRTNQQNPLQNSQLLRKLGALYELGCSLPNPQSCQYLNQIKTQNTRSLPTFQNCLIFWGDSFQSTTSLSFSRWETVNFNKSIYSLETGKFYSVKRERKALKSWAECMSCYFSLPPSKSKGISFKWPGLAPSRKATKWGTISMSGTALTDITNPFSQEFPFLLITYLPRSRFAFYLKLTLLFF